MLERLGAVPIDYRNEEFLTRVRSLPGKGVDVVLDGLGGAMPVRSFRALRPGGRLVVFGYSSALTQGRRSRRAWIKWNAQTASVAKLRDVGQVGIGRFGFLILVLLSSTGIFGRIINPILLLVLRWIFS